MDLEQALKRIEELEETISGFHENNLDTDDKNYVSKLKEDMKKAAYAREESKKKAEALEQELQKQKIRFNLELYVKDKGCLDSGTFLNAMEKESLPAEDASETEIENWFEEKKIKYAYFFAEGQAVSEETEKVSKTKPLIAARGVKTEMNTKQKAALAYKAS